MKRILFICFITFVLNYTFGQESVDKIIYLDSLFDITTADKAFSTKIIREYQLDKTEYQFASFDKLNRKTNEGTCNDKECSTKVGLYTEYYENNFKKCDILFSEGKPLGKTTYWYENGKIKEEGQHIADVKFNKYILNNYWDLNNNQIIKDGNGEFKNNTDKYELSGNYLNGFKDGKWIYKVLNSKYNYTEIYSNGSLSKGESTDKDSKKYEYLVVEKKPEPKKGIKDFYEFIGKKFVFSNIAWNLKVKGKIILSFVVDTDGQIIEPKIIKGLGYGLDEEAIRVVTKYQKWIPGSQRGVNKRCKYNIPIILVGNN